MKFLQQPVYHEPKLSIIMRIAEFYKVSIDYLVGLTDDPTPYPKKDKGSGH